MEERRVAEESSVRLRRRLNEDQLLALNGLESFGWELKFIRKPLFQEPIPVVVDLESGRAAVLGEDGSLIDDPTLELRD